MRWIHIEGCNKVLYSWLKAIHTVVLGNHHARYFSRFGNNKSKVSVRIPDNIEVPLKMKSLHKPKMYLFYYGTHKIQIP